CVCVCVCGCGCVCVCVCLCVFVSCRCWGATQTSCTRRGWWTSCRGRTCFSRRTRGCASYSSRSGWRPSRYTEADTPTHTHISAPLPASRAHLHTSLLSLANHSAHTPSLFQAVFIFFIPFLSIHPSPSVSLSLSL